MKRIGKSLAALALALVMSLTLLPVQAMAAEVGTETASDGALLDGYLYQLAGMDIADYERGFDTAGTPAMYAASGNLTAAERTVYNTLKEQLILIANGQRKDTVIQTTGTLPDQTSADKVWQALLADLPYALYWHDKTVGIGYSYIPGNGWKDITFKFAVAAEFRDGSLYTTDIPNVPAAVAAAKQVVSANRGKSDHDKLQAYRQYICDQVSYNFSINAGTAYGNPWQLLWVFDGDASTNVVCEGYAKAFKYLCDLTEESNGWIGSVETLDVTGTMDGGRHMWNVVRINGTNYLADVTNCDQGMVGYPRKLFLCGIQTNGSGMYHQDTETTYIYDTDTRNSFKAADLAVSATGFDPSAAAVPANVTMSNAVVSGNTIVVTWQAAAGAATYTVYRMGPGDTYWKVVSAKQSGTSYTDKNVTVGSTYKYTVRGVASDSKTLSPSYDGTGVSATMPKPVTAPANVTMSNAVVSGNTIVVTWQAAAGAATYNVYRMGPGDTYWKVVSAKQSGTSYTDKNVTVGSTYKYTVRGVASDSKTLSPSYDGTGVSATMPKPVTAPANVTMSNAVVSGNTIVVTWQAAAGAATYNVYRMGPGDTYWKVVSAKQSGTSYTDKNVTVGSTYKYTVRGVASDGKTLSPSYDGAGKSATMPKAPDRVTMSNAAASGNTIVVTWQAAANAATYNVYRMGPGDTYWKVVSAKQSGTSYTDKNVTVGSTYKYTVRGVASDSKTLSPSYDGTGVSATMPKPVTAPANVTMSNAVVSGNTIVVTWQAAAGAATYNVYRMGPGDTYWKVVSTKQSGTSYTDKNVKLNSTYKYTVRGVAADGTTLSPSYDGTGKSATMPKTITPADVKMSGSSVDGSVIVMKWQAAAGAATYNVYRMGPGDTYWKVVSTKQSGTSYTDKNVKLNSTYKYTVRGVAADGTTLSPSYDGTGKSATMPKTITPADVKMSGSSVDGSVIVMKWQAAAGAATYNVYRMGPGDTYWKVVSTKQSGTSYTDKNVKLNSTYKYTVRGVAADGTTLSPSYDGTGKSATMPKTITPADVKMSGSSVDGSVIVMKWQAAAGAATYNVYRMGPGDTYWKVVSTKQSGTSYTDKNVKLNSTYKYTVRGVAADGTTLSPSYDGTGVSAKVTASPSATPAYVTMKSAVRVTSGTKGILLTWTTANNAKTYNVYRAANPPTDSSGNPTAVSASKWVLVGKQVNGLSFKDTTGKSGTTYAYTVRGVAADGKTLSASYQTAGLRATMP
ncbi:MAG: hypothetical protein ACLVGP_03425 [Oscillospiraceae bacterium]